MPIRSKLIIIFLALVSIPLLLVNELAYSNFKKSLEANRLAHLKDLAIFRADRIDAYFTGLKADIAISQGFYNIKKNLPVMIRLAGRPENPEFIAAKKMLDAQLKHMLSVSEMTDIMLVSPEGIVVYAVRPGHYLNDLSKGQEAEQKAFAQGIKG